MLPLVIDAIIALAIASGVTYVVPCASRLETVLQFSFIAIGTFLMTMGFTTH